MLILFRDKETYNQSADRRNRVEKSEKEDNWKHDKFLELLKESPNTKSERSKTNELRSENKTRRKHEKKMELQETISECKQVDSNSSNDNKRHNRTRRNRNGSNQTILLNDNVAAAVSENADKGQNDSANTTITNKSRVTGENASAANQLPASSRFHRVVTLPSTDISKSTVHSQDARKHTDLVKPKKPIKATTATSLKASAKEFMPPATAADVSNSNIDFSEPISVSDTTTTDVVLDAKVPSVPETVVTPPVITSGDAATLPSISTEEPSTLSVSISKLATPSSLQPQSQPNIAQTNQILSFSQQISNSNQTTRNLGLSSKSTINQPRATPTGKTQSVPQYASNSYDQYDTPNSAVFKRHDSQFDGQYAKQYNNRTYDKQYNKKFEKLKFENQYDDPYEQSSAAYNQQPMVYDQSLISYDQNGVLYNPNTVVYDQSGYDPSVMGYNQNLYNQPSLGSIGNMGFNSSAITYTSTYEQAIYDQSAYEQAIYDQSANYNMPMIYPPPMNPTTLPTTVTASPSGGITTVDGLTWYNTDVSSSTIRPTNLAGRMSAGQSGSPSVVQPNETVFYPINGVMGHPNIAVIGHDRNSPVSNSMATGNGDSHHKTISQRNKSNPSGTTYYNQTSVSSGNPETSSAIKSGSTAAVAVGDLHGDSNKSKLENAQISGSNKAVLA